MRRVSPLLLLLSAAALAGPAVADVYTIDPTDPKPPAKIVLPPDEAARLQALQSAVYTWFQGDLSPDDRVVLVYDAVRGLSLLDVRTGAKSPVSPDIYPVVWLTERRWLDPQTAVLIGAPEDQSVFWLVRIDRSTGAVTKEEVALPGFPISLSTTGRKTLLARPAVLGPSRERAPGAREVVPGAPPVRTISIAPRYLRSRTAPFFEAEAKLAAHLATAELELVVYDLATKKEQVLMTAPVDTAFASVAWAPNDQHVSLVRWKFPDNSRGGGVPDDDPGILDALGWLRPTDNPFFTSNVLDLFRLHGRGVEHVEIRPSLHPREVFVWAVWSPESRTVVAQVWHPAALEEREHPTYANPDRSLYRFYTSEGCAFRTHSTPETGSISSIGPFFFSPHEMVVVAPWQMGWGAHVYDLRTGRLRRLPIPEGAVYQGLGTRATKELVFNFGSFQEPPEVYRVGWRSLAPIPVTAENAAIKPVNQIRVDRVRFDLPGGRVREGRLVQPKGAAFPPTKVPIVVWQQGGPTGYMGNDWGGSVEQPFALLPNFGFAVLMVPLEGRVNLGPRLLNALADGTSFGQVDVDEGVEISREMVKRGWTRHDQLGITGCSYGGYFTSQSITSHPGVYAAANTQCTLVNLVDESDNGFRPYITYLMGRTTKTDLPEIERDSPLHNATKVETPTLIFDGTDDFLPYQFSEQFHDSINGAGTDADFYVFMYEGHGLGWPTSQLVAGQAQIHWFRTYLKMH